MVHDNKHNMESWNVLVTMTMICQYYKWAQQIAVVFHLIFWKLYLFVCLWQKGAQFYQFDWPRTFRSQVSTYSMVSKSPFVNIATALNIYLPSYEGNVLLSFSLE